MTNGSPCLECGVSHDITIEARQAAYVAIYRAQIQIGDKLPWREEQALFHKTIHEYHSPSRGKIEGEN